MLNEIMTHFIILHNIIIEDECDLAEYFQYISNGDPTEPKRDANMIQRFIVVHQSIKNREIHTQLQDDLVEDHWLLHHTS
jgi:hypothetical protein